MDIKNITIDVVMLSDTSSILTEHFPILAKLAAVQKQQRQKSRLPCGRVHSKAG